MAVAAKQGEQAARSDREKERGNSAAAGRRRRERERERERESWRRVFSRLPRVRVFSRLLPVESQFPHKGPGAYHSPTTLVRDSGKHGSLASDAFDLEF